MRKIFLLSVAAFLVPCLLAQSESIYSSIVGDVTDASGAGVPGASVVATNVRTNVSNSARSDGQGHYRIERLITGVYVVTAEQGGFKKFVREGVTLSAEQSVREVCGEGGRVHCRFTHVYPDGPAPYFSVLAPARLHDAEGAVQDSAMRVDRHPDTEIVGAVAGVAIEPCPIVDIAVAGCSNSKRFRRLVDWKVV